jgi:hypothetical protein
MVHVREPNVGTRYGVEAQDTPTPLHPYKVDSRPTDGDTPENATPIVLSFRGAAGLRMLNLSALAAASAENSPRQVALNLEQLPYVQEFKHLPTHQESRGSTNPATLGTTMSFRGNRSMTFAKFIARQAELDEMES